MGEFTDKIKGGINNAIGNAKQESDNPDTRAQGNRRMAERSACPLVESDTVTETKS